MEECQYCLERASKAPWREWDWIRIVALLRYCALDTMSMDVVTPSGQATMGSCWARYSAGLL